MASNSVVLLAKYRKAICMLLESVINFKIIVRLILVTYIERYFILVALYNVDLQHIRETENNTHMYIHTYIHGVYDERK